MNKIFCFAAFLTFLSFPAWAQPSNVDRSRANVKCARAVEKVALYDFEWTDSAFEMKFTFIFHDKPQNIDTYMTDKVRLKNEFGIWRNHFCMCAWDAEQEQVFGIACEDRRY